MIEKSNNSSYFQLKIPTVIYLKLKKKFKEINKNNLESMNFYILECAFNYNFLEGLS